MNRELEAKNFEAWARKRSMNPPCGYNLGGNVMMNAKQNTDTERLDFLFRVETVEFSKNLDGKYCCFLYDQEVDIHGFGDSYRAALDEAMAKWEDISCL